jgi:hypothetical protein
MWGKRTISVKMHAIFVAGIVRVLFSSLPGIQTIIDDAATLREERSRAVECRHLNRTMPPFDGAPRDSDGRSGLYAAQLCLPVRLEQ